MIHRHLAIAGVILLIAATSGCSRYYWSKPGATQEAFTRDSQECVQQAGNSLPRGAGAEPVEQFYRACLNGRGYTRATQLDPPPPGYYRGVENTDEFTAAARAAASRPSFEQQLAQLDELKSRGRITDDEYATMRRRLVETAPATLVAPAAAAPTGPTVLAGRWYGRDGSTLDIRTSDERELEWEWERGTTRAAGRGTAAGTQISLSGRLSGASSLGAAPAVTYTLTWDGPVLRGISRGQSTAPIGVEFMRERP